MDLFARIQKDPFFPNPIPGGKWAVASTYETRFHC